MSIKDLVSKFTWTYRLPVELPRVVAEMRKLGVDDEINYWPDENLSPSLIKGYMVRWVQEDEHGDRKYITDITYAKDDPSSERLAVCKELLHIFDDENSRVRSEEELSHLMGRIILPPHLADAFSSEASHVKVDKLGEIMATTVLFPFNARMRIITDFKSGKLTLPEIAEKAQLPLMNTALVMNDVWLQMHRLLLPGRRS